MTPDTDQLEVFKITMELDGAQLDKIKKIGMEKEFRLKELLFDETQEIHEVYLLLTGKIVLRMFIPKKGNLQIGTIYPGSVFSWSALFPPYISTASAIAMAPVKVLALPANKLLESFERDPELGYHFMRLIAKTISQRLSDTRLQLANVVMI